jgi:carbonic anhydrase/acetyltransferase-like protein (isoleucine patch superfamily)
VGIYALGDLLPCIHPSAFVHPDAVIIGAVTIGADASIWPTAVLRGDFGPVTVGARTSIQDGTVVHTSDVAPTSIGVGCVVGHNAHLEGCVIGDRCLIGSGSVVLNHVTVEPDAAVGAAALVPENAVVPSGSIAVGVPARYRPAPQVQHWVAEAARRYADLGRRFRQDLRRID